MSKVLSETQYQKYIIDYLKENNGYIVRKSSCFDRYFAMDKELLFKFLNNTQPDAMKTLKKIHKESTEDVIINYINNKILSTSLIDVLKSDNLEISNVKIRLMYTKPATSFNKTLLEKYNQNIFSVMKEVWASDEERIDLVTFVNGLPITCIELKSNASGQSYEDAIEQYRTQRNPQTRLLNFKTGCLVKFAMDLEEVHMTTKLTGEDTYFLPFNKGNGEGINAGKGNPLNPNGFPVSYMWEDILQKDTIIELIHKFIFVEKKERINPITNKTEKTETVIFPRYHQLDCIRKLVDNIKPNPLLLNYLLQHSPGSGKTNTIVWLAHYLASLHDNSDNIIFDNIIIITDRTVVDRQLQKAVQSITHKSGLIKVMDDKCTSDDLQKALESNTKIIVTTIQKFLYIADITKGLKNKKFAVIIDEAHSSTAGKDMAAVTKTLGSDSSCLTDIQDLLTEEIKSHGKQPNVSMFAFTATPKATTLQLFGQLNKNGYCEAFHLYSMKQAIEEGFILDVLQNYTTYQTFYKINKQIASDPWYKNNLAKKQIARFAMLHDTNITQRIEIIVEHFRNVVMPELNGQAKAMIITASRPEAVKYYNAIIQYCKKKGYSDIAPLAAFSGKVSDKQIGKVGDNEYSESSLNRFSEERTAQEFDKDNYQILIVANKYQTGFDQPKLCALYILKKLKGVNAVQTLSRLNRPFLPFNKKVFILDFENTVEDMEEAFAPYYTTTLLCNSATPELIYELEEKIDNYHLFDSNDTEEAYKIFSKSKMSANKKEIKITYYLSKAKRNYSALIDDKKKECLLTLGKFVRFYEYLLQVSSFTDTKLQEKYNFICWLLPYLKIGRSGRGFDLSDKIKITNFYQKKEKEIKKKSINSSPIIKLPTADAFHLTDDEERKLSEIIRDINNKTGKAFDNDVAVKAALQIRDLMLKNEELKASAKNNTVQDFEFAYFDNIDEALLDSRTQNQDFFNLLLNNEKIRNEVLGVFLQEIYNSLKESK